MELLLWVGRALVLVGTFAFLWRVAGELRRGVARTASEGAPPGQTAAREGRLALVQDNSADGLVVAEEDRRLRLGESLAVGEEVTLGRDETNDVMVRDRFTSGRHARVFRRDGVFWLEDLGSKNGTLLNGHRISQVQRLLDGDRITIGSCSLRFMG